MNNRRSGLERLSLVLLHHPVYDKSNKIVTTAIVTLDIHDLCRLAATYGLKRVYIVNPLKDQIDLAHRLVQHWVTGYGSIYNPTRKDALLKAKLTYTFDDVLKEFEKRPIIISTTARKLNNQIDFGNASKIIKNSDRDILLCLGTGYGLTSEFLMQSDYILIPIDTGAKFNHLSVRCAAAIIVDRLYCSNM